VGKGGIDFVFKLLLSAIVVSKLRLDKLFEELSLGTAFKENTFQSCGLVTIVSTKFLKKLQLPS
jgi:hypothetical protein